MDPNTTYSTPPAPPVIPPPPQPAAPLKTSRLSSFIYWLHTHKKLALTIICIIFLFGFLFFLSYASLKNLISPPKSPDSTGNQSAAQNRTSLILTTPKLKYSQSEKIIITAVADSQNKFITGFDVLIKFDPEFLSLTDKKSPALPNFDYFGSNENGLLQTSAVQKTSITAPQVFKNQKLFEFEFTAKKSGKTQINIVYMPNSTSDSNLINNNSQDILNNAKGVEITID